jgi:hypothetical protein
MWHRARGGAMKLSKSSSITIRWATKAPLVLMIFAGLANTWWHWSLRGPWVFYAILVGYALAFLPWWRARELEKRRDRRATGRCAECGYDLHGNVSGVCPECGTKVE